MSDIVTKKLVPAGEAQKTNWYHSRQRGGYAKVNKKHTLLGFDVMPRKAKPQLRAHPEYQKWSYKTRNNFSEWTVTYDRSYRRHVAQLELSLQFA